LSSFIYGSWLRHTHASSDYGDAELGYAVTDHVAQGRTVTAGLAVITGTEDRQHAYVALTRGTDANLAYVFTTSPKRADPVPGPRPAPELARYDQIHPERDGVPAPLPPGPAGLAEEGCFHRRLAGTVRRRPPRRGDRARTCHGHARRSVRMV
jgi:hypothetical protein